MNTTYTLNHIQKGPTLFVNDQEGKVMLNMPTAGTVDYYAFPDNVIKHFLHDLEPFWYAKDLGRIGDYYAVRPSW